MKSLIAIVGTLAACGCLQAAELTTNEMAGAQAQATNALAAFRRFVTSNDLARLGFLNTNEVNQAVLGEPFRVYRVSRTRAGTYMPGLEFSTLIEAQPRVIFPLVVSTNTKSSAMVRLDAGGWVTENWGNAGLGRQLAATRDALAVSNAPAAAQSFAVEIPVIGLWFVGYTNAGNNTVEFLTTLNLTFGTNNFPAQTQVSPALMQKIGQMANRYGGRAN